jgi:hypothetical protein
MYPSSSSSLRSLAPATTIIGFVLLCAGLAEAEAAGPPNVVYVDNGTLWMKPATEGGRSLPLARVSPYVGAVKELFADKGGSAVLMVGAEYAQWVDLTGLYGEEPPLACPGGARLEPDGTWVVCVNARGVPEFHHMKMPRQVVSLGQTASNPVLVASGVGIVFIRDDSIWGLRLARGLVPMPWKQRVRLASAPIAHLEVAPNGQRAVGRYKRDGHDGLYSLALDGKGALRKIDGPFAVPMGFSLDSKWVAIQDIKRSCAVLATGGEYKCWDGYRALAIDPSSSHLLLLGSLGRDGRSSLYTVPLAGTRPAQPIKIADKVLTATWLSD